MKRKFAMPFAATILAARKLAETGDKPCPAREAAIVNAVDNAERILDRIYSMYPQSRPKMCLLYDLPYPMVSQRSIST